jgi:hypothetical protein
VRWRRKKRFGRWPDVPDAGGAESIREQTMRVMQPVTSNFRIPLDAIHRALDNLPEAQTNNARHAAAD